MALDAAKLKAIINGYTNDLIAWESDRGMSEGRKTYARKIAADRCADVDEVFNHIKALESKVTDLETQLRDKEYAVGRRPV